MLENLNAAGVVIIIPGIIVAINQLLKAVGFNSRFSPIINILLGFMALPAFVEMGLTWYYGAIGCLILGLSAGGFYDLGKTTILNK